MRNIDRVIFGFNPSYKNLINSGSEMIIYNEII